jgi:hypothetical protein
LTPPYQYPQPHNVSTSANTERVRLCLTKQDECWIAQYAIDGHLCVPFYVHESTRRQFRDEASFLHFVEQKAVEMLDMYGPSDKRVN